MQEKRYGISLQLCITRLDYIFPGHMYLYFPQMINVSMFEFEEI